MYGGLQKKWPYYILFYFWPSVDGCCDFVSIKCSCYSEYNYGIIFQNSGRFAHNSLIKLHLQFGLGLPVCLKYSMTFTLSDNWTPNLTTITLHKEVVAKNR